MEKTLSGIRLDENHVYWRTTPGGEVRVYGFSEILRDLGVTQENNFYTEFGRDRGTAIHAWVRFLAEGNEASELPDPRISGYLAQFQKFIQESGFKFKGGEEPVYHPSLVYATTPDLYGDLNGVLTVIDVKGGAKESWHPVQTAAQKLALAAQMVPIVNRYSLYLKEDSYRLVQHTDKADEMRWTALVTAFHAKSFYSNRSAL